MEEIGKYEKMPGIRKEFLSGLRLFSADNFAQARECFRKLELKCKSDEDSIRNLYLSYYGLTLVQLQDQGEQGLNLCRRAAHFVNPLENYSADILYNLALAEQKSSNRRRMLEAVKHGLDVSSVHAGLNKLQQDMKTRGAPIFSSLSRDHFLNRAAGKLLQLRYRNHS